MLLPEHEFSKPASLRDSLTELAEAGGEVKLLAGGTDVVFNMRGRLFRPDVLLSIRDLPELQEVEQLADGAVSLGAGCRLSELERHALLKGYPGLIAGLRAVASRHVRNMATLGGNLNLDTRCWYANQTAEWRAAKGPCLKTGMEVCHAIKSADICVALNASDIAPALLALDASVVLASLNGERTVKLADYYTDDGVQHTVRRPDEIMTRVLLPKNSDRMAYIKETARKGNDFAYATIAASADGHGNQCSRVRIVLGSLTTRPALLLKTAAVLVEHGLDDTTIKAAVGEVRDELGALTNLYTPAAYKGRIARALVREALQQLREQ
ncbi:MAG: FAD binding domain-containing protein [Gammaproteobacteria bacterium]|jgi:4-hydroxybenzoyl-CoA reductase subunit beta|nr:FAD binding domain-containing protein [Gammaproteobacteria bacterium]MDP6617783.1 FAD binding domain-containing protein [Gammaproteobacteria bacterium]MDP6694169.1 FAD binding domain-containing protein [Gammaproteobacteria bacterium]